MHRFLFLMFLFPSLVCANWTNADKKTPEETLNLLTIDDEVMNAYLWLPENHDVNKQYAAIVMAHGCGGAHYRDTPSDWIANYISGKYKVWGKLLNQNDLIVLMVDSFTHRDLNGDVGGGTCGGDPLNRPAKIDPISVRPADIAYGIKYLKSRADIDTTRIGVLGFSNGGTSALVLANHQQLLLNQQQIADQGKEWFDLPFSSEYQANTFIALYPGCGLNGYSQATQNLFSNSFETYNETFLFAASNDTSLPSDTLGKCHNLRILDASKSNDLTNMQMVQVPNTNHQFDYNEKDEAAVIKTIDRILALFNSM